MGNRLYSSFVDVAQDAFAFLVDEYACSIEFAGDDSETGDSDVLFRNATTFVNVHLERRDAQVIVSIGAVRGTEIPSRGPDWFDLGFLLLARGIPFPPHCGRLNETRGRRAWQREVHGYAAALRTGASDVLVGNFDVLPLVASIRSERRKYLGV